MSMVSPPRISPVDFDTLLELAQREHRARRFRDAVAVYRAILLVKPDIPEVCNNLGRALDQLGLLDEAIPQYQRAVSLKPDLFLTHNNLGNAFRKQGNLDQAAACFGRALAVKPNNPDAHNNLGNVLADQGKFDEAAVHYQRAVALKPDLFQTHNNLGNLLRAQGKLDQALVEFKRALALRPDYADAENNLGNVFKDQRKLDQAATHYERAVVLKPDHFIAHNNLANILRSQGKLEAALARFEQVLVLKPDFAEAHNNIGNILKDQGKLDQAAARYQQAIVLRPDFAEAHFNLANALRDRRDFEQAVVHYERALALKPDHAGAYNNLGTVFRRLGRLDEALASFERALALKPKYAEAHNNMGNMLRVQGKLDQAAAHYQQALAFKPDIAEAHYNRADLKTFTAEDPDLAALEVLAVDSGRLPSDKLLHVHFALGKAYGDVGDYGRGFEHWLKGNAMKRREIKYNEATHEEGFRRVRERFSRELLDRFRGLGDPSQVPIFVLGMPRSGSTLVEQILASHSQVYAAGELKNLDRVVREVCDDSGGPVPIPAWIAMPNAADLRSLGQAYLASLPVPGKGEIRISDKMPKNFFYIGLIHLILPNAKIVHTMRDPVDTCISCFSRCFTRGQPFTYDLAELGRYYRHYYELMAHWRSILPSGVMLDVSYEAVVDNIEEQGRRLVDYCGLPWEDRCLKFHETERPVGTASNVQVRRPLYRSSVERWRRYEAYLQPLLEELKSCRQLA